MTATTTPKGISAQSVSVMELPAVQVIPDTRCSQIFSAAIGIATIGKGSWSSERALELRGLLQSQQFADIDVNSLIKLVSLTRLKEQKGPFFESSHQVFEMAQSRARTSRLWLRTGLMGTTLLSIMPFLAAIPQISDWAQEEPGNNLKLTIGIVCLAVVANIVNFIATGTFPSRQTDAAEKSHHYFLAERRAFEDACVGLIHMKRHHPQLANLIVEKLDVVDIERSMRRLFIHQSTDGTALFIEDCCRMLRAAASIVVQGECPAEAPAVLKLAYQIHLAP